MTGEERIEQACLEATAYSRARWATRFRGVVARFLAALSADGPVVVEDGTVTLSRETPMPSDRRSYAIGPTIPADERPWPIGWEQDPRIDDGHAHEWECVLLAADGQHRVRVEEAVRCAACHAPRCGHSTDPNPCLMRRHHRTEHHYADGGREAVGA